MNEIYVLNRDFSLVGIIDEYVSVIWRTSYSGMGDFEIYVAASDKTVSLLKENVYVARKKDISVKNGVDIHENVMIVKNIQLITDVENGDYLCVTGRELKYILHQRIVWNQTNLNGPAEEAIRKILQENAVAPSDPRRIIPGLKMAAPAGLKKEINRQTTGAYLDEIISEICLTCDYGWKAEVIGKEIIISVYEGSDRSHGQSIIPCVVFSDEFENLYNTEYGLFTESYANTALVAGEGEGIERKFAGVNTQMEGFERYEIFCDARDISSNAGTQKEISPEEYNKLLIHRGEEKIVQSTHTENFSGEVLSDVSFAFNTDFFLGDMVTVINKYGINRDVRVISAVESEDETGEKLLPQFNI